MGKDVTGAIQHLTDQVCASELIPGLAISVWKEGEIDQCFFAGFANVAANIKVGADTVFHLGSISKTYTSILIFKLIEEGKLSLNDKLGYLLKEKIIDCADYRTLSITIADLLTHRSGLPFGLADVFSEVEILAEIRQACLLFDPGSAFKYSTIGYSLLGLIAEIITGKPYKQLVRKLILNKAQLDNTFVGDDVDRQDVVPRVAESYAPALPFNLIRHQSDLYPTGVFVTTPASVGIFSTIGDLATLGKMLLEYPPGIAYHILTPASFDIFLRSDTTGEDKKPNCLSGLLHNRWKGAPLIYQTGYVVGQSCALLTFPEQKICIALMCNRWKKHTALQKAAYKIFDYLHFGNEPVFAFADDQAFTPADITGSFRLAGAGSDMITIVNDSGNFFISNGYYSLLLSYLGKNIWTTVGFKTELLFVEFEGPVVIEITWKDRIYVSTGIKNSPDAGIYKRFGHLIGTYRHYTSSMWYVTIKQNKLVCIHNEEIGILEEQGDGLDNLSFKINGTYFYDQGIARFSRDDNQILRMHFDNTIYIKT